MMKEIVFMLPELTDDLLGSLIRRINERVGEIGSCHDLLPALAGGGSCEMASADAPDGQERFGKEEGSFTGKDKSKGWCLVTTDGYSIGWGKLASGMLKNHYPKGLRINY